jgi:hypothetical protein
MPPTLDAVPPTLDAVPPTLDPPVSTDARRRHTHVTPAQVLLLQSVRAYPAVSLLLSTTPAPVMSADDRERLLGLLDRHSPGCAPKGSRVPRPPWCRPCRLR